MNLNISVCRDKITIEGQIISRPTGLSPSQWVELWENITHPENRYEEAYDEGYTQGEQDGKDSVWPEAYQEGYNEGYGIGCDDSQSSAPQR